MTEAIIIMIPLVGIMIGTYQLVEIFRSGSVTFTVRNQLRVDIHHPKEMEISMETLKDGGINE